MDAPSDRLSPPHHKQPKKLERLTFVGCVFLALSIVQDPAEFPGELASLRNGTQVRRLQRHVISRPEEQKNHVPDL